MEDRHENPAISVCIPVYNAARYIGECIDSILAQTFTDYEILIADDGSTDDTLSIVATYTDPRIRVIHCNHNYIATLNRLIDEARGRYIARMDADDVMCPDRLQLQYEYMEAHPKVGILGGGMQYFGNQTGTFRPANEEDISLTQMLMGCCIAHPTVMMSTATMRLHNLRYHPDYIYAEDYHLWLQALTKGVVMRNLRSILINYRTSDSQISTMRSQQQQITTHRIQEEVRQSITDSEHAMARAITSLPPSSNLLTVVIPFLNEGEEVENTVRSIRETAGSAVDIIVVNDCSEDRFDYADVLRPYHVHYIYNATRIGAAASKEKGVQHVVTPYFLLLDAHMRFYDTAWHRAITDELSKNGHRLLCCQTIALVKEDGVIKNHGEMGTFGAYLLFEHHEYIPGIRWNGRKDINGLGHHQIPAVMGAGYATSTTYWNHLRGYQGLVHYGCEEVYISTKAWLEGGGCYLLPDVKIGHIYREKMPYSFTHTRMIYNYLVIVDTLFPTNLRCLGHSVAMRKDRDRYDEAVKWMTCNRNELQSLREYYRDTFRAHDFAYIQTINSLATEIEPHEIAHARERLGKVVDYVYHQAQDEATPAGLCCGLMGVVILLCEYSRYTGNTHYEDLAEPLFERVCDALEEEPPITFGKGVCGIGWGILYLQAHGFLDDPMEPELAAIDRMVMERDVRRTKDSSIRSGIGGVMAYVVNRIGQAVKSGKKPADVFPAEYIEELKRYTRPLVTTREVINYRVRSLAMQVQLIGSDDFDLTPPAWDEVVHLTSSLPADSEYWSLDTNSAIGYGINRIYQLRNRE